MVSEIPAERNAGTKNPPLGRVIFGRRTASKELYLIVDFDQVKFLAAAFSANCSHLKIITGWLLLGAYSSFGIGIS